MELKADVELGKIPVLLSLSISPLSHRSGELKLS